MKVCSTQVSSQSNLDNKTSSIILTSERSLKPNLSRLLKTGTDQNPLALAMGSVSIDEKQRNNLKKKNITKNIWITLLVGVGITTPPLFIITILFFLGTFTSFAILEETE